MWKNGSTLSGLNVNKGFVFNQIGKCYILDAVVRSIKIQSLFYMTKGSVSVVENNAKNNCSPLAAAHFIGGERSCLVGRFVGGERSHLLGRFVGGERSRSMGR
jgi:hypothetical protein